MQSKSLLFGMLAILSSPILHAQTAPEPEYIEVTGSAEMEIVPDEIYITVVLAERYDGREKVTIEQQDTKFLQAINAMGIPAVDVQLSDAVSDYSFYKWRKEDALATKEYIVLVHSAAKTSELFKKMVEIDAENAMISRVSHSKIEAYRKEVKINAMKATYEKAGYMLNAISQEVGDPIVITELTEMTEPRSNYSQYDLNYYRGSNFATMSDGVAAGDIGFQKIKIKYEIYGKFEIK